MDDGRGDEDSDIIDYFCDGMMAARSMRCQKFINPA